MNPTTALWLCLGASALALLYGVISATWVLRQPAGNERMQEIAAAVQEGANAYMNRQYSAIGVVGVSLFVILGAALDWATAIGFAIGAIFSALAGYIGMFISVRANVRTAQAATAGINPALQIAFRGGAITGLLVVGLGLLGVAGYYGILLAIGMADDAVLKALIGVNMLPKRLAFRHRLEDTGRLGRVPVLAARQAAFLVKMATWPARQWRRNRRDA